MLDSPMEQIMNKITHQNFYSYLPTTPTMIFFQQVPIQHPSVRKKCQWEMKNYAVSMLEILRTTPKHIHFDPQS